MKTLVIYHKADWDGLFSREICRRYFGDSAEYLGWDYGDPVPAVGPERPLVMVDISVEGLMDHPRLVWIDHHKSAIAKFPASIPGYRIDGVAACRLAWTWFEAQRTRADFGEPGFELPHFDDYRARRVAEPYAVQLAGEYDVWDKRNPEADVFQHALRARELAAADWAALLDANLHREAQVQRSRLAVRALLPLGEAIMHSVDEANASLARDAAFVLQWEGLRFIAINKPRANSRTFAAVVGPRHDALLTFYWLRDKWRLSLYHAPHRTDLDLSAIAVRHGGGGHRGACGFEARVLPFQLGDIEAGTEAGA